MKTCYKCKEEKSLGEFSRDKYRRDGLRSYCKDCEKAYRQENKELIYEKNKVYCQENKEAVVKYQKAYQQANKEAIAQYYKDYIRERRRNNPTVRLLDNMRTGLYKCLKGVNKTSRTLDYVGKTSEELMSHLEEQFTEGMTRENYGQGWTLDHIRPLASFEFTGDDKEEQLHKAWNYTNLQPLWAADNRSKGDRWEG